MPTTHVEPGSDPLLQEIANTLWKARKVVVITGAGISTNSGIPDFRSENGLYSLIQAQFDAARPQAGNSDADVSDASLEERPTKRRRLSRDDSGVASQQSREPSETLFPGLQNARAKDAQAESERGSRDQTRVISPGGPLATGASQTADADRPQAPGNDAVTVESETGTSQTGTHRDSTTTPRRSCGLDAASKFGLTADDDAAFPSSPPSIRLETPRPLSRPHLLDRIPESSSPLSSPPPVMFDPYQDTTTSPSHSSESSRSQSEEPSSLSTPFLSSQTSFASSSRNSLPVMKGKDLFDAQIWSCPVKTAVFYTFVSTLRQKVRSAEPTSSHHFVSVLRDSRKLVRCYTQNIDQLEERVGLTTSLSLGAGSRYRFSARAGRASGVAKNSAKGADAVLDASQGSSQQEPQEQPQADQAAPNATDSTDSPSAVPASQTTSYPSSTPNDASTSAPSGPASAPAAPNRGVECVFLHGSLAELRCFVCARTASWDEEARLADTLAGRQPTCPHCAGATAAREEKGKRALGVGKLRPDIVLYGEEHPHAHLISPLVQHDLSLGPDMLLILGTSMRVHGLKVLVREFAKAVHDRGGKVVFVNFTKPPESVWADIIDYWVQWDCDAWVGDLQQRKPALWLPPGAMLLEEEKAKTAKPSRRQSAVEPGKRKEGADKAPKKSRESDGPVGDQKGEDSRLEVQEGTAPGETMQLQETAPLPPPPPKLATKRPAKVAREPKLNPDAKRPASIRDHKLNGAYLVWKIMGDLYRITGGGPARSVAPSPVSAPKPKSKRPRKSAPAALDSQDVVDGQNAATMAHSGEMHNGPPTVPASSPMSHTMPAKVDEPIMFKRDSSISAAVKTRKRKQAVAWRMINGVETRVSLTELGQPELPPPPHTRVVLRPSPVPKSRRLPPPTPSPERSPQHPRHLSQPGPPPRVAPLTTVIDVDAGFRETDRLIAQMHIQQVQHQQQLSRSATPTPLCLPPLQIPPGQHPTSDPHPRQQPQQHVAASPPKLEPLEPKVHSPGPRAEIPSNVGSPVASRTFSMGGTSNPFFLADPLEGWLGYPPYWMRQYPHPGHFVQGHHPQDPEQHTQKGVLQVEVPQAQQPQPQPDGRRPSPAQCLQQHESGQHHSQAQGLGLQVYCGQSLRETQPPGQLTQMQSPQDHCSREPHPEGRREVQQQPGHGQQQQHLLGYGYEQDRQRQQHQQQEEVYMYNQQPLSQQQQRRQGGYVYEQEHALAHGHQPQGSIEGERGSVGSGGWCPDEQLRKEQEAAMMLSALSGRGGGGCY
ncbi:hypothetical protein VTI74DRAFT_10390 [Chaetomium olivicolor]